MYVVYWFSFIQGNSEICVLIYLCSLHYEPSILNYIIPELKKSTPEPEIPAPDNFTESMILIFINKLL